MTARLTVALGVYFKLSWYNRPNPEDQIIFGLMIIFGPSVRLSGKKYLAVRFRPYGPTSIKPIMMRSLF